MRLLVMGTAEFAVPTLRECAAHHEVVATVTQPERPGDRGQPAPRPLADAARELGLPVLQPERVREPALVSAILGRNLDGIVVAAYGQILPPALLTGPRHGAVNVHASLLPRWRGAAPVAHAILAGDRETGVSIMRMDEGLDTGPVYAAARLPIAAAATTPQLSSALADLGAQLLIDVLAQLEGGAARATPQPQGGVTLAPRLRREAGRLRWEDCDASTIDRHVRALQPWPGVTLTLAGVQLRVLEGACCDRAALPAAQPGEVVAREGDSLLVAAASGVYRLDRVQPPGRRPMTAAAFLRGRRAVSAEAP